MGRIRLTFYVELVYTRLHRWAVPPVLALAGACSSGSTESVANSANAGDVVADTSIVHTAGSRELTVGGARLELPIVEGFRFDSDTITVPASWPVLAFSDGSDDALGVESLVIGVAVFQQTDVVVDDATRAQLFMAGFAVPRMAGTPISHESTTTGPDGRTCWTVVRSGSPEGRNFEQDYAVVLVAGDGIASSGLIVRSSADDAPILSAAGDIVESACGNRPGGL